MHTLAHVAKLHEQSKDWGHDPKVEFTKPGDIKPDADALPAEPAEKTDVPADDQASNTGMMNDAQMSADQQAAKWLELV